MIFPFINEEEINLEKEELYIPREYGINFETGQLTGKVVEGIEALKVWAWLALQTQRYRYYIYSSEYGQEYEDLIGKRYSPSYTAMELERMTNECLTVNPYITGIENFSATPDGSKVTLAFTMVTSLGDTEVDMSV